MATTTADYTVPFCANVPGAALWKRQLQQYRTADASATKGMTSFAKPTMLLAAGELAPQHCCDSVMCCCSWQFPRGISGRKCVSAHLASVHYACNAEDQGTCKAGTVALFEYVKQQ